VIQPPFLPSLLAELAGQRRHSPRNANVRLAVRLRARDACEYCLLPTTSHFQIDHVIPPRYWAEYAAGRLPGVRPTSRRSGPDHLDNFAWCCPFCHTAKGQQVAHRIGRRTNRLFDPRRDHWPEYFILVDDYRCIVGLPGIGQATEQGLRFNDSRLAGPLGTRHDAVLVGRYPPHWARGWLVSA